MRVAVTAAEPSLDGAVDPRFGRCPYFVIVETDDLDFEAVENPNVTRGGGAGIQSAQLISEKGARFVLTGNCGPNAHQTLSAAGIGVIVGCSGLVRGVVEQFKAGRLSPVDGPNVAGHFGTGGPAPDSRALSSQHPPTMETGPQPPATGMGMGRRGGGRGGMGRGVGRGGGRGRGMGRGMGRGGMGGGMGAGGMGAGAPFPAPTPQTDVQPSQRTDKQEELRLLKKQAEAMGEQMQEVQERIRQLEEEGGRS